MECSSHSEDTRSIFTDVNGRDSAQIRSASSQHKHTTNAYGTRLPVTNLRPGHWSSCHILCVWSTAKCRLPAKKHCNVKHSWLEHLMQPGLTKLVVLLLWQLPWLPCGCPSSNIKFYNRFWTEVTRIFVIL